MAADIAPELLKKIREAFIENIEKDDMAAELLELIDSGKGTYKEAGDFAERIGEALSKALQKNLSSETLPDGKMYWNIADRVLRPMLEEDYKIVSDVALTVQEHLNKAAGLGIKAHKEALNQDRVDGILNKVSSAEKFDDVAWVLDEPLLTFSRSIVDDTLKKNVEFQGKAGLSPKIIRQAERKCCKWCKNLAGVYDYPDVPQDVYRRHENCRCVVDYDPGSGKRQNIWSKKWNDSEKEARIEERKFIKGIDTTARKRGLSAKIGGDMVPLHDEPIKLKQIDYGDKEAVLRELQSFEKSAIKESIETAYVITESGEVYKCFGVEDRVFPDSDLQDKLKGASVSHNHLIRETTFSFSDDDLQLFMDYDLEILRGCDEKYTYEFTRELQEVDEDLSDWQSEEKYQHVTMVYRAMEYGIGYRRWRNG